MFPLERGCTAMSGILTPVLPYFMIVSLLLTSAIPTMERVHGSIARQYARLALAIVGVSEPSAYRLHENTGNLLKEVLPTYRNPHTLALFDESQEVPTVEKWRKLESHLGKIERLGNRLAEELEGRG
jgi:hypothetical protein